MKIINLLINKKSPNFGGHTTVLKSQSINNTNEHYKIHIHIKPNNQGDVNGWNLHNHDNNDS